MKTTKGTELPLLNLKGKDYLEVKYRILWFREEHPNWSIQTELIQVNPTSTLAKATIRDDQDRILSTGHKYEDKTGFADHIEKAETGAIGRALALIGYGTQFAIDLDEGDRIVDSPIQRVSSGTSAVKPNDIHAVGSGTFTNPAVNTAPILWCTECNVKLLKSAKSGDWYCANFKDKTKKHTYVKAGDIADKVLPPKKWIPPKDATPNPEPIQRGTVHPEPVLVSKVVNDLFHKGNMEQTAMDESDIPF